MRVHRESRVRRGPLAALLVCAVAAFFGLVPGTASGTASETQAVRSGQTPQKAAIIAGKAMTRDNASLPYFVLKWTGGARYRKRITQLRAALKLEKNYKYTKVRTLLNKANAKQIATKCDEAKSGALSKVASVTGWLCFEKKDADDTSWSPQGITGTWDAHPSGTVNKASAFAVSWHYTGDKRSRVTFLRDRGGLHRYNHVLLVRPTTSGKYVSYANMATHAGGMVWYKRFLLVADENRGILVFDTHNLLDLTKSKTAKNNIDNTKYIGRRGNKYYSQGFRYVLPLSGEWRISPTQTGKCLAESKHPCYTYVGLDRSTSPPTLLTGEWCDKRTTTKCTVGRIATWSLKSDTTPCSRGCLVYGAGSLAQARHVYTQPSPFMQGGNRWSGQYAFAESHQASVAGTLFADRVDKKPLSYAAGEGVQTLYWRRRGKNRTLWSVTEFHGRGRRVLYGVTPPVGPALGASPE